MIGKSDTADQLKTYIPSYVMMQFLEEEKNTTSHPFILNSAIYDMHAAINISQRNSNVRFL